MIQTTHSLNVMYIMAVVFCTKITLEAAQIIRGPYLQSASDSKITVCWRTDEPTTSELATGPDSTSFGTPTIVSGTRTDHFVALTGLQPATRYFYRISGTPISATTPVNLSGTEYWFKTSPSIGEPAQMRMWVIGDSGSNLAYTPYIGYYAQSVALYQAYLDTTSAAGKTTDLWMMIGDNAYNYGTDSEFQISVFNKYPVLLRNSVLWSAFGNHDIASAPSPYTALVPYDAIMSFPTAGECGGLPSGSERYYSFDRGNVHFIALDSTTASNLNSTQGSGGMFDWLVNDLKATTAQWVIAFFHHAPYSRGSQISDTASEMTTMRQKYLPILEAYGVDLVLAGHSHVYERSGLISGHYGTSGTWDESMRKQTGNGSDLGGVNASGLFITGAGSAQGSYQKPMATPDAGTVYAVVGSSGALAAWNNTSSALVNPNPYPAHAVNLLLMGGLTVDIQSSKMTCQFLDNTGAVRDDFTIHKGSTYTLQGSMPTTENGISGIAFPVSRTGAINYAEQVPVAIDLISGPGVTPAQGVADFSAGQTSAQVRFFPLNAGSETQFEARLLPTTRALQPGSALKPIYQISGSPQPGQLGGTPTPSPATIWYSSRFGVDPPSGTWNSDDDGDGLSLLLEYAFGGEPDRNDSELLPKGTIEGAVFVFRYNRPSGRTDVTYGPQSSENLVSWPFPGPSDENDGPVTPLGEPRRVELPIGSSLKFIRLQIGLLP